MKAAPFAYHRPDSVDDAAQMLTEFGEDAKILAGGQSLTPMLAMRLTFFDNLIDISRLDELKGIERAWRRRADRRGHHPRGRRRRYAGGASVPLLTRGAPAHRSLPDPQPRDAGRRRRARRPGRGVPGGGADPGCRDGSRLAVGQPPDRGRRLLHRPVGDRAGARRGPDRGRLPGLGWPVRLRIARIRPPARRFRDRRRHGRRRARRR